MSYNVNRPSFREPMSGGRSDQNWKDIRELQRSLLSLTTRLADAQRQIKTLQRSSGNVISPIHPLKLYQLPLQYRQSTDANAPNYSDSTDWLKWRVRAGAATLLSLDNVAPVAQTNAYINITGTDGVANPDIETYLDNPLATDILIPPGTAAFYFWVTLAIDPNSGIASAQVYYGTDPGSAQPQADNWSSFPQPDPFHQLIAVADSLTQQANNTVLMRQLARADLLFFETNPVTVCDGNGNNLGNSTAIMGMPQPAS